MRNLKFGGPWNPAFTRDRSSYRWCEDTRVAGLRLVGYVKEFRASCRGQDWFDSKPSLGWYADNSQGEIYHPAVWRLPRGRFMYGFADPCNDGAALLANETADNEQDAQAWACSVAKSFAEDAREDDAKFQAEQQIEELREEIAIGRRDFLALCREMRAACKTLADYPTMRAAIESRLREIVRERTKAFEHIEKLTDEPWQAVANW